jgi:hypothetical protein
MNEYNKVSVILALNKLDEFTFPAINSVLLSQNIEFQLVIICNGKNNLLISNSIKKEFPKDSRIKYINTPIGQLSFSLNLGISESDYKYIARMDADDICSEYRLAKQYDYMIENNLDLVGSDIYLINEKSETIGERIYPRKNEIKRTLIKKSPFCHPSVMFKKSLALESGGYNAGLKSEDYDFWIRLQKSKKVRWDNIEEKLLYYRIHNNSTQGDPLAYAEVSSYFWREFLMSGSLNYLYSFSLNSIKHIYARLIQKK